MTILFSHVQIEVLTCIVTCMDSAGLYARLLSYIFIKNLRQWIKKHLGLIFRCNQISFLSYSLQNLFIVKVSGNHLPSIFSNDKFCVYVAFVCKGMCLPVPVCGGSQQWTLFFSIILHLIF